MVVIRDVYSSGGCGIVAVVRSGDEDEDDEVGWTNEAFLSLEYCIVLCSADWGCVLSFELSIGTFGSSVVLVGVV